MAGKTPGPNKGEGGRPGTYETASDLKEKVEEYFIHCEEKEKIPNMAGISYFLGFDDKESFKDQSLRGDDFSRTVKAAKNRIYEEKFQFAAQGKMNPTIFIFDSVNNHDMYNTRSENKNDNKTELKGSLEVLLTEIDGETKGLPSERD